MSYERTSRKSHSNPYLGFVREVAATVHEELQLTAKVAGANGGFRGWDWGATAGAGAREVRMVQKLFDAWPVSWVSIQAGTEDRHGQRVSSWREFDGVALVNDGVDLLDRVAELVERRILVDEAVEHAAQGPDVRLPADLLDGVYADDVGLIRRSPTDCLTLYS